MLPIGSFAWPEYTTSRLTGRVTPLIVRSPVIVYWSCAACSMRVLLKVIVGKRSTSRKSGDFRCASRWLSCVLSVLASIVASTEEAVKSSSLKSISAFTPVKAPLTVIMPMCLAENSTWVCIGSTDQLIATLLCSVVVPTTIPTATVCQATFHFATSMLRFRRANRVCGGRVSVRSEASRAASPGPNRQSRWNAWHAFLVAHAALEPILNRELEAACGLPLRWFDVLVQLHAMPHKRLSMTELANAVLLSKSGLTRLVDRIEQAGLVERASAPGDRRSLLIVLTPNGEKTLKRAAPIHEDGIRRHFAAYIRDNQAAAVEAALGRIAVAARQYEPVTSQNSDSSR